MAPDVIPSSKDRKTDPGISAMVREHLGREMRAVYDTFLAVEQPTRLVELIARLEASMGDGEDDAAFRTGLMDSLPGLRAFAMTLAANPSRADDLVQETLLKAWTNWKRFEPGTNLKAWLSTILRNQFYTECRKRKREVEDADGVAASQLIALPSQEHGIELGKVWAKVALLPAAQREALILVAAQGMTYEAAAGLIGCQVGTMKSRVSRARSFLVEALGQGGRQAAA